VQTGNHCGRAGFFQGHLAVAAAIMPSTSIRKTDYDPQKRVLSVWFVASGRRYDYEGVPPEIYAAFRDAFAKGRFFNDHIRDRFQYRLVADA
jgi:hypothetical protein